MPRLKTLFLLALTSIVAHGKNPILSGADPHAAFINGTVWIYPTHSEKGKNFFAFKLTPQKTWEKVGPILDLKDVTWLKNEKLRDLGPWAPCIAEKSGRFYFYYSVGPQSAERPSQIGVAEGNSPAGPFKDSGKVLLSGGKGFEAIDPMVFEDPANHKSYLYAGGSAGAKLRVFELSQNMTDIKKEIEIEQPKNFTEGCFMHYEGGLYHLTYSHGNWKDSTYSVHHSTSKSSTGPWEYRGVILKSDETHKGPGHHAIVQVPNSDIWYIIYHCWNHREGNGPYSGSREIAIDKLFHDKGGDIKPVVMTD